MMSPTTPTRENMCGRYALYGPIARLHEQFDARIDDGSRKHRSPLQRRATPDSPRRASASERRNVSSIYCAGAWFRVGRRMRPSQPNSSTPWARHSRRSLRFEQLSKPDAALSRHAGSSNGRPANTGETAVPHPSGRWRAFRLRWPLGKVEPGRWLSYRHLHGHHHRRKRRHPSPARPHARHSCPAELLHGSPGANRT